ncbi:hypothetical protein CBR_g52038 [Chara braunii]|uniref:Integrase catalytic domain-containing protein n=1 Tax=Chara braunii TaxID=69332 RepID=A0A388M989_CHABU|nr:hypothetical protein CBR_g52038 [Chara braunii]|eukprot:GBG91157.1 hypothetical protein CBR_g52038 [Chara braunii]
MATEDETGYHESEGGPGLGGSAEQSKEGQKDRESTNPDDTKGNRKEMSSGESSGKVGGGRQGTQEKKEGRNKDRASPENSEGAVSKKVRVTDARRKLAEIEKRTAEYKAMLIEEMMIGNEEGPLQEVPRDERKTSGGGTGQGDKGSDRGGTSSKRRKERENSPGMEAEKATNPLAIDSRASRLPTSPAVSRGCEGLWSLRERVLGWFHPEGTTKTRGRQKAGKEGPDTSMAGEASSSEGGLRKIVSSLARALNKNQRYLADAKKKLTFDGANITQFVIDDENLDALLKWTEEEKMDHLGQHLPLSLGRDIMTIVAANRFWKETRDVMMRKYLAAEKMVTEADLAAVQRKNFATYNDFLREFTLVAVRIPGVTDRIMNKYFLRQFSEFDKDKILHSFELARPRGRRGDEATTFGTKLSFHALPVGKLKIQIGIHHTDALVDGEAEITLIRRDFATMTGCTVNKEVRGSIRAAGGEIPFAGYVAKCAVRAGVRESIWSFQRMTVMEEMDHDIILGRPWCANVEMIGMHSHDGSYMVDIEDPVTGRGELLRLLGMGGDPPKGKLATWSPSFEDSMRKGTFARMEGMRERVEIMIEEAFNKKEWIKMGLPQKKRRQEDEVLGVMAAEKESEVELGISWMRETTLSGFVEAIALKKKTGRSVADWIKDFYLRYPFVRRFIADNETEFVNQEVLGMLKRLCVPIKLIEPYHPEANAPVERGHRTLKNTIARLAADHLGNWPRYLKQVVFAENMIPKRTTGCIPVELWYRREIDFPVEALIPPTWNRLDDDPQMTTEELIEARCQQILKNEEVMEDIANRVLDSRMRDKARWDQVKNVRKEPLQVGEMILLRNSALESTWSGQLGRRFKGPYRVAKRMGLNTFELEDLDETGFKGPFPGLRLVRFLSRDPVEQWLQDCGYLVNVTGTGHQPVTGRSLGLNPVKGRSRGPFTGLTPVG